MSGFGQTFNQVTTLAGLTDGNYLIAADGNTNDGLMLNSTAGSVYIDYTNITNPGATINSGFTGNNIFSITVSGGNITINNSTVGYVSWGRSPATANDADFYNGTVADTERWTPTVSGGLWTLSNVDTSARMLQWNNSSPRFSAYTSNQVKLKLYKQAVTGPAITATPTTITGLDYGFGNGPSTEQSFDVTGTLLVAGTTVTSNSTDFQVSLTAVGGYASSVNIPAGTLNGTTTIYTRLVAGLAINTYSNTISISNATPGIGTTPTINVSGEVTPPQADVVITEIMYNTVGTDDEWIEICNLNGTTQDISNYIIEVNNSPVYTFPSSTNIPANSCITLALGDNGSAPFNPDCPFTADYGMPSGTNTLNNTSAIIELIASDGTSLIDTVFYADADGADGNGSTLQVIDAAQDNSNTGTNWQEVAFGGTPGVNSLSPLCLPSFPDINVEGDIGTFPDIAGDGSNIPVGFNNTLFPSTAIATATPPTKSYRIQNTGTVVLNINAITLSGVNSGDFTVSGIPTTVNPGSFETFNITFSPLATGDRTAIVSIDTDDPDAFEDPYVFNIKGKGVCTESTISVSSFAPLEGPAGTEVTIIGNGFSATSTVSINGLPATVISGTATELVIEIPDITNSGPFTITEGSCFTISLNFALTSDNANCGLTELIMSEIYDENGGSLGYIEVYNGTGNTIDLSNYYVRRYGDAQNLADNFYTDYYFLPSQNFIADGDVMYGRISTDANTASPDFDFTNVNGFAGINGEDIFHLYNATTLVDVYTVPNSGIGYSALRDTNTLGPNTTDNPSDWTHNNAESTSNLGTFSYVQVVDVPIVIDPVDISGCVNMAEFQVTATAGNSGNALTYQWYYNEGNGTDLDWEVVSGGAFPLATVSGINTDTLIFTDAFYNYSGYQFYCLVTEDGACGIISDAAQLKIEKAVWTSSGWSSPPSLDKVAIIDDDYDTSDGTNGQISFDACSLIINSGKTLVVRGNDYVNVNFDVTNNGTFMIENNGSLVQIDDSGVNTGNINMERKASVDNLDYVYWSSPASNFDINNISTTQYIYKWNPTFNNTNGTQGNWIPASGDMDPGVGYIVRGFGSQAAPVTPGDLNFTVNFVGVPFNGLKPVTLSKGNLPGIDDNWNLVGNPYPSAVDVFLFLDHSANSVLDGFVHFWTHGNDPVYVTDPFYYDFGSNYTETDYIPFNAVGAGNAPGNISIAAGQSFMVNLLESAPNNSQIEFNNSMRDKDYDNSQFYRTTEPNYHTAERHRIWLDLVSESHGTNRILVGYVEGATMERDRMYDVITSVSNNQNLYSLIDETPFIIQGRPLPFNDTDAIPLGVNIVEQGIYHIAIAYIDGLFETDSQIIYLKDNALGFIHNLNEAPYSFASDAGNFNNRFELVFRDAFLSINEEELTSNNLTIIEHNNGQVQFIVPNQYEIKKVEIIDLLGRTIYNLKASSYSETYNLSSLSQATYIAKITLSNGQVISKKVVKRK
jgi:hypothetical protein